MENYQHTRLFDCRIYADERPGAQRRPEGDPRAFLENCIAENGLEVLAGINGVFSGSTERDGVLCLFRDHMGAAPLYYYLKDGDFACADDIRTLCARDGADLTVNERWLYLECRSAVSMTLTETEFQYIHCVRPGSWTEFIPHGSHWEVKEHIYWQPGQRRIRFRRREDYFAELRHLVEDAVRIRLDTVTGPVGAEASGGLDSSIIDILLAREGRKPVLASWSRTYEEIPMQPVDERQVIEDICRQEGLTFRFIPPETAETNDGFARFLPPFVNTLQISRTAKMMQDSGVQAVFTGHGGDEGISHRCGLAEFLYYREYSALLREMWHINKGRHLRLLRTLKQFLARLAVHRRQISSGWQNGTMDLKSCLNPDFAAEMAKKAPFPVLYFGIDPVQYILQGGSRSRLDNCALQAKDFGVHYEFPFLDYRVIDFAVSIPRGLYLRNGQDRYIYRETFRDLMPESLYRVDYKDFASQRAAADKAVRPDPDAEALRKAQTEWAEDTLSHLDWARWSRYFDREACFRLLITPFPKMTEAERGLSFILSSMLYTCALLQNLQDNSTRWAESQNRV